MTILLLMLLWLCMPTAQTQTSCPTGWRSSGCRCFLLHPGITSVPRSVGGQACQSMNNLATLPSVTSSVELSALWTEGRGNMIWTALNKGGGNQISGWDDGAADLSFVSSPDVTLTFDDTTELCVVASGPQEQWQDRQCSDLATVVCQIKLVSCVDITSVMMISTSEAPLTTPNASPALTISTEVQSGTTNSETAQAAEDSIPETEPDHADGGGENAVELASATVNAMNPAISVVVGINVAAAVVGSAGVAGGTMAGYATGVSGSSIGINSGSGLSTMALLSQVQFMTLLGYVGGNRTHSRSEALQQFSEGFGWATLDFDFILNLNSDSNAATTNRRQEGSKDQATCGLSAAEQLLQRLLLVVFVLLATYLIRVFVQWCIFWYYRTWFKAFDFPTWEGPCLLVEFFAVCQVAAQTISAQCLLWTVICVFLLLLGPVALIVACTFFVTKYVKAGELQCKHNETWGFSELQKRLTASPGCTEKCWVVFAAYWKLSFRQGWEASGDQARKCLFVFKMYRDEAYLFFVFSLTCKMLKNIFTFVLEDSTNAGLMLCLQALESVVFLQVMPFIDPSRNLLNAVVHILNLLTIVVITFPALGEFIQNVDFFSDVVAIYLSTTAVILLAIASALGPVSHALQFVWTLVSGLWEGRVGEGSTTLIAVLKVQSRDFFKNCCLFRAKQHFDQQPKSQSGPDSQSEAEQEVEDLSRTEDQGDQHQVGHVRDNDLWSHEQLVMTTNFSSFEAEAAPQQICPWADLTVVKHVPTTSETHSPLSERRFSDQALQGSTASLPIRPRLPLGPVILPQNDVEVVTTSWTPAPRSLSTSSSHAFTLPLSDSPSRSAVRVKLPGPDTYWA